MSDMSSGPGETTTADHDLSAFHRYSPAGDGEYFDCGPECPASTRDGARATVARMRHVVEEAEAYIAAVKEGDMVGCAALEAAVDRYVAAGRAAATPAGGTWETRKGWIVNGEFQRSISFVTSPREQWLHGPTHQRRVWFGPVEPVPAPDATETGG